MPCAVGSLIGPEGERRPYFGAVWKLESEGRDPDDFVRLAIKSDRSTEDVSIPTKSTLPHALAQDDTAMLARHFLFRQESAAECRLDAERSKEVGGNAEALNTLGFVAPDDADVPPLHRDEALKRAGL